MRTLPLIAALALAACTPAGDAPENAPGVAEADGCAVTASRSWRDYQITASTQGADCAEAEATIVFVSATGAEAWIQTYPVAQVMVLAGSESPDNLQQRLTEWISPPGGAPDTAGDLPEWPVGAQMPMSGEFPFYVDEGVTRQSYEAARAANAPMFCYVQGMESSRGVLAGPGGITTLGVQSFPG